jgi:hypothetical protein
MLNRKSSETKEGGDRNGENLHIVTTEQGTVGERADEGGEKV